MASEIKISSGHSNTNNPDPSSDPMKFIKFSMFIIIFLQDVFTVSVGNLPPQCEVLIKITYIAELRVEEDAICFNLPASVAPWLKDSALAQKTQVSFHTDPKCFRHQCLSKTV